MHIPVLQKQILKYLNPKPNENFIDATIGEGGHTIAILQENMPHGKVLGIETDTELYQNLRLWIAKIPNSKFQIPNRLVLVNDSYTNLEKIVEKWKFYPVNGILFDLGMSSWHLEKSGRGFTFQKDEPLDMRYNLQTALTAKEILNQWSEDEIEKILKEYGEERFSKKIAAEIVKERKVKPVETTFQLKEIIKKAIPKRKRFRHERIHFATRTFQALRIAVNEELDNLRKVLAQVLKVLSSEGRLVVISFHSLEDRIVKNFLKNQKGLEILTKKPIKADLEEIRINPRARSAKLRAAKKHV